MHANTLIWKELENQTQPPLGYLQLFSGPLSRTQYNLLPNHAQIPIDID